MMNKLRTILILFAILFCNSLQAQKKQDSLPQLKLIEIGGIGHTTNMFGPTVGIYFEYNDTTHFNVSEEGSLYSRIYFDPPIFLHKKNYNLHYVLYGGETIQNINVDSLYSQNSIYISSPRLCNNGRRGEVIFFYKNTDSLVNSYCDSIHHFIQRTTEHKGKIEISILDTTHFIKSQNTIDSRIQKIKKILYSNGWKDDQIVLKRISLDMFNISDFNNFYLGSELFNLVYPSFRYFYPADLSMIIKYVE